MSAFSLPTQRCFPMGWQSINAAFLFSAYAEVFPEKEAPPFDGDAFLCLRRGVSSSSLVTRLQKGFSLPTQRCFWILSLSSFTQRLFSAYAEVFPSHRPLSSSTRSFLCLRRGVSSRSHHSQLAMCFSLPTQRCFPVLAHFTGVKRLFSAYAEVFSLAK